MLSMVQFHREVEGQLSRRTDLGNSKGLVKKTTRLLPTCVPGWSLALTWDRSHHGVWTYSPCEDPSMESTGSLSFPADS